MNYRLNYLRELESESIFIIREVFAQFKNTAILFSGGKDSIVLTHLAQKALWPSKILFPLVHIDTGHNFPETLEYRDWLVKKIDAQLIVGSVQNDIDNGRVCEELGIGASRNTLQTTTLLETIEKYQFDACMGGARRDEEKARAKERVFSHRDDFGQWNPKNQRPELWDIFNAKKRHGEHFRVFPISNWTELDVWQYILAENIKLPKLYFSHTRKVFKRNDTWISDGPFIQKLANEILIEKVIRFRTCGDMTITGAFESTASSVEDIIKELTIIRTSERDSRADDKRTETSMEDRKKQGYF